MLAFHCLDERLRDDKRWKYSVPPAGNANFAWVQHIIHHLAHAGVAGFVLANGSMSSDQSGEGEIRKNIIVADLVDCMVALPGQLFYSTHNPACLWFLARDRRGGSPTRPMRDRRGEFLYIDASKMGRMVDRTHRELTAEWEAANAEWIAERQAFYERLPRLVILALLAEKAKRAGRAAATVLITALMKYVFLFQMEGNGGRRRLYHFVPYHYGPFARELYTDLGKLQEEGLVQVESNREEDKMKITLTDQVRTEALLAELPEDLKEDAATVISTYGDLDHNSLLEVVYEKYPAYAKKSRLRQRRA